MMGPGMFNGINGVIGCLLAVAAMVIFAAGAVAGIYGFVLWMAG